jgi:hypothetical protein
MFGWFRPRCPLVTSEKVWVETRMAWLTENLGASRLREARVIEPTDEFFPGEYRADDGDAKRIFRRLAKFMQIDSGRVELQVVESINADGALGEYRAGNPAQVLVLRSLLDDAEALIATLAHELAHEILLGGGLLQGNDDDLERLTDLTMVFLGVGIFGANAALREQHFREGRYSSWSIQKHGYLPMRMYGYGLALFAWSRNEPDPAWAEHLRLDVREPMRKGLRYLLKTEDSTFDLEQPSPPATSAAEVAPRLAHRSASFRYLGLWELVEMGAEAAPAAAEVARLLDDRDAEISGLAARVLGTIGPAAAGAHADRLHDMLWSGRPADREGAAFALGEIRPDDAKVVRDLVRLLDDSDRGVASAAVCALGNYGSAAHGAAQPLLKKYQVLLVQCDYGRIEEVARTLCRVLPDAVAAVREQFEPLGSDLADFAHEFVAAAAEEIEQAARCSDVPQPPAGSP